MKKALTILTLIMVLSILGMAGALAQDEDGGITYGWNQNSESDVAGYKIYIGKTDGYLDHQWDQVIDVKNVTRFTVSGLEIGETYHATVTCYDTWNNESGYGIRWDDVAGSVTSDAKDIIFPSNPTGFEEKTTNVNPPPVP